LIRVSGSHAEPAESIVSIAGKVFDSREARKLSKTDDGDYATDYATNGSTNG
jgi:hypothetical protein